MMNFFDWLLGTDDTVEVLNVGIEMKSGMPAWLAVFLLGLIGFYCYKSSSY